MRRQKTELLGRQKVKLIQKKKKKKLVIWCNPLEEENLENKIK